VDWLTFISQMFGHLAWPLVVAVLVVFLSLRHRGAVDALLQRVRKAKAGPFEAELDKAEAAAAAASLPPAENIELPRPSTSDPEAWLGYLLVLADIDPRGAVMRAYNYLNSYARQLGERLGERTRYTDGSPAVMRIAAVGILAPEHLDVLDRLREAALSAYNPEEEITPRQAREYVELVARVVVAMRERFRALPDTERN
jgi:hypothetical protein